MTVTPQQIYEVLDAVADPCAIHAGTSVVQLGVISDVVCDLGETIIRIAPTTGLCPHTALMIANVKRAVVDSGLVDDVKVELALATVPISRKHNPTPNEKSSH